MGLDLVVGALLSEGIFPGFLPGIEKSFTFIVFGFAAGALGIDNLATYITSSFS